MEFFVVHYAPDLQGRMNVGVVLFERVGGNITFAKARFTRNMQRILAWDSDADIAILRSLFQDIERTLDNPSDRERVLSMMQDTFSNVFQLSEVKGIVALGEPEAELDRLASVYLPAEADPQSI